MRAGFATLDGVAEITETPIAPVGDVGAAPEAVPAVDGREVVLAVNDVTREFVTSRHTTLALDRMSFEITRGEFMCVAGPSGWDKSTLLTLIAGLDQPSSGSLVFEGKPIRGADANRVVV